MSVERITFPLIDVLRGIAALFVLVYHVIELGHWTTFPSGGWSVFRYGWVGVNLFLVVSGFVIGLTALRSYDAAQQQGTREAFAQRFLLRRWRRIAPLFFLTGLIYLFLIDSHLLTGRFRVWATHLGAHALFAHNLAVDTFGSINGPNWSVALEMQFYLAMVMVTPWIARSPAFRMVVFSIGIALAYRWLTTKLLVPSIAPIERQHIASVQLPGVLEHFGIGIFLAQCVRGKAGTWWHLRLQSGWANCAGFSLVAALGLWVSAQLLLNNLYWDSTLSIVFMPLILASAFGALVSVAVTCPWASSPAFVPFRYVGEISYGIYLWHLIVILSIIQRYPTMSPERLFGWTVIATLAIAAFSWHWIERPNIERGSKSTRVGDARSTVGLS